MQVRSFIDYAVLFTQTRSEQRVHDILPEAMAQNDKHYQPKQMDAETRPHNICLAEQRLTESYLIARLLMRTVASNRYHTVLVVNAPCYTLATSGDFGPKAVGDTEQAHAALIDHSGYRFFYVGGAHRALLWFRLPRASLSTCS